MKKGITILLCVVALLILASLSACGVDNPIETNGSAEITLPSENTLITTATDVSATKEGTSEPTQEATTPSIAAGTEVTESTPATEPATEQTEPTEPAHVHSYHPAWMAELVSKPFCPVIRLIGRRE